MLKKTFVPLLVLLMLLVPMQISSVSALEEAQVIENDEPNGDKVPILLYHNILEDGDVDGHPAHVTLEEFIIQMQSLTDAGYTTISFQEYYSFVNDDKELPEKPIIITFDDGYLSNYEYAFPILQELGMKATIFILTGRMGAIGGEGEVIYPHFTWEQAKEMDESGVIDIQSHSDLHPNLVAQNTGRIQLELRRSRYLIQKELGKICDVFAYPFGMYTSDVEALAEVAGYKITVAVGDKGTNTKEDGLKELKRLTVFGGNDGDELLQMIQENIQVD